MILPLGVFTNLYPGQALSPGLALLISLVGFFLVFIIMGFLALFVKVMGAVFDRASSKAESSAQSVPAAPPAFPDKPEGIPLPENTSAGDLILENVSEEEAAVVMAVVSHRSGIPLNRLQFHSIRCLEEEEQ